MRSAAAVLVTAVLALAALAARVEAIEYKCSANLVIGEALWSRLEGEGSPKELDLTHRLNSKGERYGRKIAYKDSELRYLELLEDFCAKGSLPKALPLPVEGSDDADSTRWVPLTSPARRELGEKLFPRKVSPPSPPPPSSTHPRFALSLFFARSFHVHRRTTPLKTDRLPSLPPPKCDGRRPSRRWRRSSAITAWAWWTTSRTRSRTCCGRTGTSRRPSSPNSFESCLPPASRSSTT
mmetsp:Transcript_766/g.2052  ORF Transcript_766/g.2052 Transcript_766/m.2052 type:complete len:238 (-) Transcript_766:916-1629(-)